MYYTVAGNEDKFTCRRENDSMELKHLVFLTPEASIEHLVGKSREALDNMLAGITEKELSVFEEAKAALAKWDEFCAERLLVQEAIRYQTTPTPYHTSNTWVKEEWANGGFSECISNATYTMSIHAYPPANLRQSSWHVTWDIWYNCPKENSLGKHTWVAGYSDKRFPNRDAMIKYIEGRKKAYAKLFQEEYPPIPAKAADLFKIGNKLMRGYTVAKEED